MILAVKSLTSLCLNVGKPPVGLLNTCSMVKDAPHVHLLGRLVGCQLYCRHSASWKSPLRKTKPWRCTFLFHQIHCLLLLCRQFCISSSAQTILLFMTHLSDFWYHFPLIGYGFDGVQTFFARWEPRKGCLLSETMCVWRYCEAEASMEGWQSKEQSFCIISTLSSIECWCWWLHPMALEGLKCLV